MVIFLNYFVIVAIAISLSMDAFSMAMSIGTLRLSRKINLMLSVLVGAFHFFMPMLGTACGNIFFRSLHVDMHILSGAIFFYIATMMFKDFKKEEETFKLSIVGAVMFALGVSLDSFGVGFALQLTLGECIRSFAIFTCCSATFTYVGLELGRFLSSLVGDYSVLVGAVIMVLLGIFNFCHVLF